MDGKKIDDRTIRNEEPQKPSGRRLRASGEKE